MKVLFIDQFSELGGAQQCLLDLLPAVAEQGWTAQAVVPGNGPLIGQLRAAGVEIVKSIRGRSFDLAYVNGPRVLPRTVFVPSGAGLYPASRFLTGFSRASPIAGSKPASRMQSCPTVLFHAHNYLDRPFAARLVGWSLRYSQATVVAVSRFVAEPLMRYAPVNIVPNGTADMGFRERTFQAPLRIGIIGRLAPEKGQAEFLRAARMIPDSTFVVCGTTAWSDPAYANKLTQLAQGLPVEFLGWRDDIAAVLQGLDLLVIASRHEGMSRVLAEAFSGGVPVIAFPVRAVSDLIDDGETGFLTLCSIPEALAARIQQVAANPSLLQRIAHNARRQWEQHYQLTQYRARLVELMRRAVAETARPPRCIESRRLSASADTRID